MEKCKKKRWLNTKSKGRLVDRAKETEGDKEVSAEMVR